MARRSVRSDSRVDVGLFFAALLISAVALALPEPRSDKLAGTLRRTILAPVAALDQRAERARQALLVHDSLTLARDSTVLGQFDAARIDAENQRLRQLLGLGARLRTGFVAAEVLHGPALGEEHTLLLSAGSKAGVAKFSPVVAPEGIVGYVRSVDERSSVAIVWPHPDFRVSAMAVTKAATGIIAAHLGEGASRFLLELRGVPYRAPLDSGTLIVSSGIGGTFPRGIPVGRILRQLPTVEGWERNYLVMPEVHPADVGSVLILLAPKAGSDLGPAWPNVDSVATAARRAAAAGDSLAKLNAARDSISTPKDSIVRPRRDTTGRGGL